MPAGGHQPRGRGLSRVVARRGLVLGLLLCLAACNVPRRVHDPLSFPEEPIETSSLSLDVPRVVSQPAPESLARALPSDFERAARERLLSLPTTGQGPALAVTVTAANVDVTEIVDARGEMTRVSCELSLELRVVDGPVLRRADTGSRSFVPRAEATPEELDFVLEATALNAFERYFADPRTPKRINSDVRAYAAKR